MIANVRRQQASMTHAIVAGMPIPEQPEKSIPLTGRKADYLAGQLDQLCASLDATRFRWLKEAFVNQAVWYATQILPGSAGDRGHRGIAANLASTGALPDGAQLMAALMPPTLPEDVELAPVSIATYCERAAGFAASAVAERWEIDTAYAMLNGSALPELELG